MMPAQPESYRYRMITLTQTSSIRDNHDACDAQVCSNINPNRKADYLIKIGYLRKADLSIVFSGTGAQRCTKFIVIMVVLESCAVMPIVHIEVLCSSVTSS